MATGIVELTITAVQRFVCRQCRHIASRTNDPWDNQYRCTKGCRCTMQGCCPGPEPREA